MVAMTIPTTRKTMHPSLTKAVIRSQWQLSVDTKGSIISCTSKQRQKKHWVYNLPSRRQWSIWWLSSCVHTQIKTFLCQPVVRTSAYIRSHNVVHEAIKSILWLGTCRFFNSSPHRKFGWGRLHKCSKLYCNCSSTSTVFLLSQEETNCRQTFNL